MASATVERRKPRDKHRELDATFSLYERDGRFEIVFHSRGGTNRNKEYAKGLEVILKRLQSQRISIADIQVDSIPARRDLSVEERRLKLRGDRSYPIDLSAEDNISDLRKAISNAQKQVGQTKGAKGGNSTKKIRIFLSSPPGPTLDAMALETGPPNHWALCAVPWKYDIVEATKRRKEDLWKTKGKAIRTGDHVLIWQSAGHDGKRGVVAFGQVLDDPLSRSDEDNPYWKVRPEVAEELRVKIKYVLAPKLPLLVDGPAAAILKDLSVAKARGGRVFKVTPEQWRKVLDAAGGWGSMTEQLEYLPESEPFNPKTETEGRQWVLRQISQRQGRGRFRRELLGAYGERCAITGCPVNTILEAAHIKPYDGPSTNHVGNGLLLRPDIHTLFDLGLIAIDPSKLTVIIADELKGSEYEKLQGKPLRLPERERDHPSPKALKAHPLRPGIAVSKEG